MYISYISLKCIYLIYVYLKYISLLYISLKCIYTFKTVTVKMIHPIEHRRQLMI